MEIVGASAALRADAQIIIRESLRAVLPDEAVRQALEGKKFSGRVILVAIGKAAWQMAKAANECIGDRISEGIVLTKYGHVQGPIANFIMNEGGHPVPDENSYLGTKKALSLTKNLCADDTVLLLISGGGSALFEEPLVSSEELQSVTSQLLACGADIVEINRIRKRLSGVKGGRFAERCRPAKVFSVVLSDVLGDPLDMIASGPAYPDASTCAQALEVVEKYRLKLSEQAKELLNRETPKNIDNVSVAVGGSVRNLCAAAKASCERLGYDTVIISDALCCEAKEAGTMLGGLAKCFHTSEKPLAFVVGGETVVHLKGNGKGGRNQEIALSAAAEISEMENVLVFSLGSDGTDGPTDAAGGIVDGHTEQMLRDAGLETADVLERNDAYTALKMVDALIVTGPTGTNVNDVSVLLIHGKANL